MPTVSLRISDNDLEEIDSRADERSLSRTAYMVAAALGERFPTSAAERLTARLDDHDARLARCEEATFWGG